VQDRAQPTPARLPQASVGSGSWSPSSITVIVLPTERPFPISPDGPLVRRRHRQSGPVTIPAVDRLRYRALGQDMLRQPVSPRCSPRRRFGLAATRNTSSWRTWRRSLSQRACGRASDVRHTWASWHVQNKTPLHALQELGSWESAEMVRRYAHLSAEHLAPYADRLSALPVVENPALGTFPTVSRPPGPSPVAGVANPSAARSTCASKDRPFVSWMTALSHRLLYDFPV
jgi:hypothetical protein